MTVPRQEEEEEGDAEGEDGHCKKTAIPLGVHLHSNKWPFKLKGRGLRAATTKKAAEHASLRRKDVLP